MSSNLFFIKGDATKPVGDENKIIAHICNDIGKWGAGFVLAISKKWKEPKLIYKKQYKTDGDFILGEVQFVKVDKNVTVANMIAQKGIENDLEGRPPIRYEALMECLDKVASFAFDIKASVHMPRIGCGLAGGKWEMVEPVIKQTLLKAGVNVFVYDLK